MHKNDRLEELSDQVRKGETVSFQEAIEIISYQHLVNKHKKLLKRTGLIKLFFDFVKRRR